MSSCRPQNTGGSNNVDEPNTENHLMTENEEQNANQVKINDENSDSVSLLTSKQVQNGVIESADHSSAESALSTTETELIGNEKAESSSITDVEDNDEDEDNQSDDHDDDDDDESEDECYNSLGDEKAPCFATSRCHRRREIQFSLPETVTMLETYDGCKVYLVGTAHFSMESQEDVAKTIQATQPDIVMVELCKGRVNILKLDEQTIIEEAKNLNLEKIRSTIKQNGFVHGIMYLFLLSMSAHLTKQLGMAPGGEFRRAFSEARKVPGCIIHLGDRPIQVTLHRALAELSVWQKLCLAWCLITSKQPISKEEVERCKKQDLLEEMLAEMTGKFPAFSRVFVKERDIYLTHSLQLAAKPLPCEHTQTGYNPSVVVGVVGIGHVPGIVENWGRVYENDIPPLLRIPESSLSNRVMKYTVKASMLGLLAFGCYKLFARTSVNLIQKIITFTSMK